MSAELEQVTLAVAAINKVEAGLAVLRETYGGVIYEITTTKGLDDAKTARAAIREPRYEVERIRKAAKAPILALGKRLDSEAARITAELEKIEGPIDTQIKAEEARKEVEKEAKVLAEIARVAEIQRLVDSIRNWPVNAAGKHSSLVNQMLQSATDYVITDADFAERTEEAKTILIASTAALQGIFQERLTHEAAQAQLEIDRQELARLRAEQADRDRLAKETQAKADADAKAERDAEAARQAEANRLERERIAREEAAAKSIRDAETAKQNAILAAERKRLADEQAETNRANEAERLRNAEAAAQIVADRERLEREQAALAEAQRPKPEPVHESQPFPRARPAMARTPDREEIIEVLAKHFAAHPDIVTYWLSSIQWRKTA
jgi:copper chaperone CopZ